MHEARWAEQWGASGPAEYLEAAIGAGTTRNGVFGAKVMWAHMPAVLFAKLRAVDGDRRESDLELLEHTFPKLRFIWLWRDDLLAQAVSFSRALQTREWVGVQRPVREPRFDFAQIKTLLTMIREMNQGWQQWFVANGIDPFGIRYEDLVHDMPGYTRSLLDFIGVEPPSGTIIQPQHNKQADSINAEWVARYRTIAEGV